MATLSDREIAEVFDEILAEASAEEKKVIKKMMKMFVYKLKSWDYRYSLKEFEYLVGTCKEYRESRRKKYEKKKDFKSDGD